MLSSLICKINKPVQECKINKPVLECKINKPVLECKIKVRRWGEEDRSKMGGGGGEV